MYSPSIKKPVYAILAQGQISQIKNELKKDVGRGSLPQNLENFQSF
jgi:hypothetical protein